ncbi:MAG: amidohydrolase family protein, partial [Butyricicoccaceae bacterium]
IARDIALAQRTGARVAFQHISSGLSVALIRKGRELGADIHAEVTPHHLSLTELDVLEHGTNARMNPPLRTERDRMALIEGLKDGTIDMIATDHAPHAAEEKAKPFANAPSGITGLETSFSVCNTALVHAGHLSPMELMTVMSKNPADFYRLGDRSISVGNRAELMIANWDEPIVYTEYKSKAANTPFTGKPLFGRVYAVVVGENLVEN